MAEFHEMPLAHSRPFPLVLRKEGDPAERMWVSFFFTNGDA